MKIVIAPDSFKGNLSAMQVAEAIEAGVRRVVPGARCVKVPMADGGEGTVQALVDAGGGRIVRRRVCGPLGRPVTAHYGYLPGRRLAVIEMAAASGLPLVPAQRRDPMRTTTFGTGELILDAARRGARRIVLGIGGSATVDGGMGMAQALGVRFHDAQGRLLRARGCGALLERIARIDMSGRDPRVAGLRITVACDVDNPLTGRRGAARVFGPQKGADPAGVRRLDAGLRQLARVIRRDLGRDVAGLAGAGAAGGLGAGLMAFTGAQLERGVDIVIRATGLRRKLRGAQLVITGEGRVDFQTAFGKAPAGVAAAAGEQGIPVVAIGGGLGDDARNVYRHGIQGLASAVARDMTLDEALAGARRNLENAAERVMRLVLIGQRLRAARGR